MTASDKLEENSKCTCAELAECRHTIHETYLNQKIRKQDALIKKLVEALDQWKYVEPKNQKHELGIQQWELVRKKALAKAKEGK